jgi:photosystem II stability/assembly factor-like uncharacterized protein
MSAFRTSVRSSLLAAACAAGFATSTRAQIPDWHMVFNGDLRDVFVSTDVNNTHHVWVCEDGARIRYWDSTSQTWSFQTTLTPTGHLVSPLLDIYVRAGTDGWACGSGGTILHDATTGGTWSPVAFPDNTAVLWGIRFTTARNGFLCGDHVLSWTSTTGASWNPPMLLPAGVDLDESKFYALEIVPATTVQLVVGVEVENARSKMLYSTDGKQWYIAMMYDVSGAQMQLPEEFDTWDIVFEPNAGLVQDAVGYMVGGVGLHNGYIFRTTDGGTTWHQEVTPAGGIETMYGAHAWTGGQALAGGYAGQVYKRDPLHQPTPQWDLIHGSATPDPCSGVFTAPWNGMAGDDAGNIWAVGAFGELCTSTDGGTTLTQAITNGGQIGRLIACYMKNPQQGWMVGEAGVQHMDLGPTPLWTIEQCTWDRVFLQGLAMKSTDEGWAVGNPVRLEAQTADIHQWHPSIWHRSAAGSWTTERTGVPDGAQLSAVALLPSGGAVAVGRAGMVLRRDSSTDTWTVITAPPGAPDLSGVVCDPSVDTVFLVGTQEGVAKAFRATNFETVPYYHPGWSDVSPSSGANLTAVSSRGMAPNLEVYACGTGGQIVRWDSTANHFLPVVGAPSGGEYKSISLVPTNSEIWVGGDYGFMAHFDGSSTWASPVNCHTSKSIRGISFLDSGNGFAVTVNNPNAEGSNGDSLVIKFY